MQQRHSMNTVLQKGRNGNVKDLDVFYLKGNGCFYLGVEAYDKDGDVFTWYFSPIGEDEAFMFLYIDDNLFDGFLQHLDESNLRAVYEAWPLLLEAFKRGVDDNYSLPALIRLGHTEITDSSFWCLALKVENFKITEPEQLLSDYVLGKLKILFQYISAMNKQVEANDPSTLTMLIDGGIDGVKKFFKVKRWTDAILGFFQ